MNEPACHSCGSAASRDVRLPNGQLYRCGSCGSVFLHPMPEAGELERLYSQEYYTMGYFDEADAISPAQRRFLAQVAGEGPRRLLDIGCGTGTFCLEAQRRGLDVTGLEREGRAGDVAAARGVPVVRGKAESVSEIVAGDFDMVTMWDVLEHVPNPGALMRGAAGVLAPGGMLALSLPNPDASLIRLARVFHGIGIRGPLERCFPPYHLYYPSLDGLDALLRGVGLRIIEKGSYDPALGTLQLGLAARIGVSLFSMVTAPLGERINLYAMATRS